LSKITHEADIKLAGKGKGQARLSERIYILHEVADDTSTKRVATRKEKQDDKRYRVR